MPEPELRIIGDAAHVRLGRKKLASVPLADFIRGVAEASPGEAAVLLPPGVRLVKRRGQAIALALELAPQARTVRWLADDSEAPFGKDARYRDAYLAFPYVVVLLVLHGARLTGQQQLYYRRAPLEGPDDPLLLPNLFNVAEGYGQRCWLCLQNVQIESGWSLARSVTTAIEHIFGAAFNRSSEVHEGNSYWGTMQRLDARVASVEAWEEATRADRFFPLEVEWRDAGTSAATELDRMLNEVERGLPDAPDANDLAGLVTRADARRRRG
ncbi:MAG: hypothetical protein JRH01_15175 [Deltaproteobacteria bacterium]|nr:hypothetical protein [Deltaproteobacteria bacterium]MBW2392844.1 hypothetical protein [Deltaproteobacteria bacterium]